MKRLLAVCLVLLSFVPVLAQDPLKPSPAAIELMALYKQAGRAWSYRVITSVRGETASVHTMAARVESYDGAIAQCQLQTRTADGSSATSRHERVDVSEVPETAKSWVAAEVPTVTLKTELGPYECKKHVHKADGRQVTTWVSTRFHPLIIKQVTFERDSTVIFKLDSFSEFPVDPFQLYRKEGRRWKSKATGPRGIVSYTEIEVTAVRESGASFELVSLNASEEEVLRQTADMPFTVPAVAAVIQAPPAHRLKRCAAGSFLCSYTEQNGVKSWTSVNWPGLLVFMESKTITVELVEYNLGHHEDYFYRRVGNSYTLTTTTTTKEGNTTNSEEFTVTVDSRTEKGAHADTERKREGKVVLRGEHNVMPNDKPYGIFYSGQREEWLTCAAGSFPVLYIEEEGYRKWRWNGIAVRMEKRTADTVEITELTALNYQ